MVKKILFITLSNIGDCILTLPALDFLCDKFPQASFTVICGERPKEIFEASPRIGKVMVYRKRCGLKENIRFFMRLKAQGFDAVIDLRNTLFGALLPARYKIPLFLRVPAHIRHMRDRHLYKVHSIRPAVRSGKTPPRNFLRIKKEDRDYVAEMLHRDNVGKEKGLVVVAPGARSHIKRWEREKFVSLCAELVRAGFRVALAGDGEDTQTAAYIKENSGHGVTNLCARTTLAQLGALLEDSALLITNDSAVLHLGSYLNVPVAAVFGPTDDKKYGPWPEKAAAVAKKEIFCRPCEKAQCRFATLDCMRFVSAQDLLRKVNAILFPNKAQARRGTRQFRRILVARTDRIGDVLLSTPALKALRESCPDAYIAMMVGPYAKDIVQGNPWIDEVIVYDKGSAHKGWLSSAKFALALRKKKFDLAIALHPTNRVHLLLFFAGIPERIGYNRKLGFLLTSRIEHTKQYGRKHESEYNFDLLKPLGIDYACEPMFMPIRQQDEKWADDLFKDSGITAGDRVLLIHPGASCPSKIWPNERFSEVADKLAGKYKFKVMIVAGPKDIVQAERVAKMMHSPAVNLAGRTSLGQLASLIRRARLFISNDSGPVHLAVAVGTPVVSIFGRAQEGLSPRRWGPLGALDKVLHKGVGCIECLAHNCVKEFACLKAISVEDVLMAADAILQEILPEEASL